MTLSSSHHPGRGPGDLPLRTAVRTACVCCLALTLARVEAGAFQVASCDFSSAPKSLPWFEPIGDARVDGGVLRTSPRANWERSGINVGPIPLGDATLTIEYDFRPTTLGQQCQEFVSQVPSTHWYMCFLAPDGRFHLYTRSAGEWQQRATSEATFAPGEWYHVTVSLARTSLAFSVAPKDGGAPSWTSGVATMDDVGDEILFALVDESSEAKGGTEWDNVVVSADDEQVSTRMKTRADEIAQERQRGDALAAATAALRKEDIALLPMPQRVKLGDAAYRLSPNTLIGPAEGQMQPAAEAVQRAIADSLGLTLNLFPTTARRGIVLAAPDASSAARWPGDQAYRLIVRRDSVRIEATSPRGFFYAAETLCQLAGENLRVRAAEIEDWPAIPNRLVMVAVSQGGFQVIDVEYWKRMIRQLAAAKINVLMPYFEGGTFYYEKYPFLGLKGRDGFTAEKARLLSEYARQRFIEMVPQQEALGHAGNILAHERLAGIRETGDVFCSSKIETFSFLGNLFDELVAAFPNAAYIHVGGDEFASGFAQCPLCKARAAEIGLPGLYAEHMNRLHKMLADRGRKMMIWWHEGGFTEQAADKLPRDLVVFDWHYGNQASYPSLQRLQQAGFANTWATPAVTRFYDEGRNDWDNTFGNIRGFLKAGARARVPGECTCTWVHGVWGGRNLFELNYYGLLYSALCAWNPDAGDPAEYRWTFARRWFGLEGNALDEQVLHAVHAPFGGADEQKFWRDSRAAESILGETPSETATRLRESPDLVAQAEQLSGLCDRALGILQDWRKQLPTNEVTVHYLEHDVHIHQAAARRILAMKQLADAYGRARALPLDQRANVVQPAEEGLRRLVADHREIEDTFRNSLRAAGGGECGWGPWYPYVAEGRIQFRAPQGRAGIEKLLARLDALSNVQTWPADPFAE